MTHSAIIENPMRPYFIPGSYSFMRPELLEQGRPDFPLMLNIEPTLNCNLRCFMCPAHNEGSRGRMRRARGFMDWGLFTRLMDECAAEGSVLVLNMHKDGESTLHPRFADMLAYARQKNAAKVIHFNTNASFDDPGLVDAILKSGVDDISLSIDAFEPETFRKVKGRDLFGRVLANCHAFFERRAALGLDRPFIRAKMLGAPDLAGEFDRFAEYWGPIADEVQVQPLHNFAGGLGAVRTTGDRPRHACEFPFFSTAVNWDGGVTLCHRDCFGEDILGDVSDATLREVYTGARYRAYRLALAQGRAHELPLCAGCDNWSDGPRLPEALLDRLCGAEG